MPLYSSEKKAEWQSNLDTCNEDKNWRESTDIYVV